MSETKGVVNRLRTVAEVATIFAAVFTFLGTAVAVAGFWLTVDQLRNLNETFGPREYARAILTPENPSWEDSDLDLVVEADFAAGDFVQLEVKLGGEPIELAMTAEKPAKMTLNRESETYELTAEYWQASAAVFLRIRVEPQQEA